MLLLDGAMPLGGLALLLVGAAAVPAVLPLGWLALGLAFFSWVAEADGLSVPRPGRLPIRTYGCWETPLAFGVRHRHRDLLFCRAEDETGAWSGEYTVSQRPRVAGADIRFEIPIAQTGGWSLVGRAPVAELRFQYRARVSYVTRRSLERALATAGAIC